MSDTDSSFAAPPATFDFLVASLRLQAEVQLGLIRIGDQDPPKPNLPMARHAIDMLGMLNEKTRGNLTTEEQRELENTLTELRFRYVHAAREAGKKEAPNEQNSEASAAGAEKAEA